MAKVSSSQALSQLARVSSHDALKRFSCSIFESFTSRPKRAALRAITAKECFARLDYIGQLSVKDVSVLFHYARVSNKSDFDRKVFLSEQSKLIRSMVTAMDMAVTVSRGTLAAGKMRTVEISHVLSEPASGSEASRCLLLAPRTK